MNMIHLNFLNFPTKTKKSTNSFEIFDKQFAGAHFVKHINKLCTKHCVIMYI